ncbi:(2Fe-2S)-binding protein [Oceanobacillus locisalsi]|uniref:(2Fe-2S)-binding protein n=1 Tax=Oceanobacillus locisalsi TaxID=546107 RepID=A0ABW3NIE7_9BACI
MDKSTIVCRCEEINIDEIETAIKNGAESFDDIKRLTRCGMGPCQSKVCFNPVSEIIADCTGKTLNEIGLPRFRMPLKMVRMSALAQESEDGSVVSVFGESVEDGESKNG